MEKKGYMRVVGRRGEPKPTPENMEALQKLLLDLRGKRRFLPRGVYRFKTHEEADAWQREMLTR
jgi:hypothetical protein